MPEFCTLAGTIPDADDELKALLMELVRPKKFFEMKATVPENVRVAALRSLYDLGSTDIRLLLAKLVNDKDERVALLAKQLK